MRRRPVARMTTGVAVATIALSSVFAGTAWAPKVTTRPADPATPAVCRQEGWRADYDSFESCLLTVRLAMILARTQAAGNR